MAFQRNARRRDALRSWTTCAHVESFSSIIGGEVWGVSVGGVFLGTITVGCEPVLEIVGLLVRRVFISVSLS